MSFFVRSAKKKKKNNSRKKRKRKTFLSYLERPPPVLRAERRGLGRRAPLRDLEEDEEQRGRHGREEELVARELREHSARLRRGGERRGKEGVAAAAPAFGCSSAGGSASSGDEEGVERAVPEVSRGPAEDEAERGQAEVARRVEGEAGGLLREEVAEDAA